MNEHAPQMRWALNHWHDRWTGYCRCGAGPFVDAEFDAHLVTVATAGEQGRASEEGEGA